MTAISSAQKAVIVGDGSKQWRARVFADRAPATTAFPYITYIDHVADTDHLRGDGRVMTRDRLQQWDLWERAKDEDPSADGALETLKALVDGMVITADRHVYRCKLRNTIRDFDTVTKIAHHVLDVLVVYREP